MDGVYNKFSLVDFLAYILPGIYFLSILFVWVAILFAGSPLFARVPEILNGLSGSIFVVGSGAVLGASYLLGCFASSFVLEFDSWLRSLVSRTTRLGNSEKQKQLCEDIRTVLQSKFEVERKYLDDVEYVGRSVVYERAPACAHLLARQSSVRQLRRNCVLPTLLLAIALFWLGAQLSSWTFGAIGLVALLLVRQLIVSAHSNRVSEIRETFTALIGIGVCEIDTKRLGS